MALKGISGLSLRRSIIFSPSFSIALFTALNIGYFSPMEANLDRRRYRAIRKDIMLPTLAPMNTTRVDISKPVVKPKEFDKANPVPRVSALPGTKSTVAIT